MTDINNVVIVGRLVKDINPDESKHFNDSVLTNFSIAVNKSVKKGEEWTDEVSFFDVELWNNKGLLNYMKKGKQIVVSGSLKQNRWEKDGQKYSRIVISATSIQLIGGKDEINSPSNGFQKKAIPAEVQNVANAFDGEIDF